MILPFLSEQSRLTLKSKISNKYLIPFSEYNTLKSVALDVVFSVMASECELKKFNLIYSKNGQSILFRGRILVPIVSVPGYFFTLLL